MTTRNQKSRKIEIFQNGLTHNFSQKKAIFQIFFQAIQATNLSSTIFYNETTAFQVIRKKSSKSRKIDIFPKGLTHGFSPENRNFSTFFLRQYRQRKCLLRYFKTKQRLSRLKKKRTSKSQKTEIFPKGLTHGFVQKFAIFPSSFKEIQARKMSFTTFQNKPTPFQAIKTRNSKSRKIDIFPKGLTHGFAPKTAIFPTFFFNAIQATQAIQARKMSFTIF